MRDVTGINFNEMNEELRVELLITRLEELESEGATDEQKTSEVQAILRVTDGTPLGVNLTEADEESADEDLTDVKLVDRMIDFHYGSMI